MYFGNAFRFHLPFLSFLLQDDYFQKWLASPRISMMCKLCEKKIGGGVIIASCLNSFFSCFGFFKCSLQYFVRCFNDFLSTNFSWFDKPGFSQRMGRGLDESSEEHPVLPVLSGSVSRYYILPGNQTQAPVLHHEHPVSLYPHGLCGGPWVRASPRVWWKGLPWSHGVALSCCVLANGHRATSCFVCQFSLCW